MLRRKIQSQLKEWKEREPGQKKTLILQGARQTGKTYAVRAFAREHYEHFLEINFKETPSETEIFSGDLKVDTMLTALRFRHPEIQFVPGKTLLFLDEIQECPEAITSLKFWTLDQRFDVIASGSLLGIDYKRPSSYPVGAVEHITLHGLDLEEFLWNQGIDEGMIRSLRTCFEEKTPVPQAVHTEMMKQFRTYIILGGMPEAVWQFVLTKDFRVADRVQRDLLQGYLYDIAHYATPEEKVKAEKCYLSLTRQLLEKENHKFQYKEVEHGGRAQKYYSSLEWLIKADMVYQSNNVNRIQYDLTDYEVEDNFRIYPTDMSLLMAMRDYDLKRQIMEDSLSGHTVGGIYECALTDQLHKKGRKLHFFRDEGSHREIDCLTQKNGQVIPLEFKSRNNVSGSLNYLMKTRDDIPAAYKLARANIGQSEYRVITIPHYMIMFL